MKIGKEPTPQKGQQVNLDFGESQQEYIEKAYLDYSSKERAVLIARIRDKMKQGKKLTERQRKFLEEDAAFFEKDDHPYGRR